MQFRDYNKVIAKRPMDIAYLAFPWQATQYERAIEDYNKAIELGPKQRASLLGSWACLCYKGTIYRAINDLNMAIELGPKIPMLTI